ncbi:orotate phosphoribosyltransferase [candidate division WOR-3 bacterium]|nr:orotate phosphoribosyltransferase [candidate division WOR-3 bacterium]
MKSTDIEKIFKEIGLLKKGHFELASGLHSHTYFEKFRLLEHPELTTLFCKQIAQAFKDQEFTTVAGPTTGGIIIAHEVAKQLKKRCIFAERSGEGRDFLRGFQITPGERILVVDDVLTTGGSIIKTVSAIKRRAGIVIGVGVIINRSEKEPQFEVPLFSVYKTSVKNFLPTQCPLCKKGIKLTKPGGK